MRVKWQDVYIASGAPERFLDFEVDRLVDVDKFMIDKAADFVSGFTSYRRKRPSPDDLGLFLIGSQGKGKSALLAIILKDLIRQNKVIGTAKWLSVPLLSMTLKSSYSTHEEELKIVRPFMDADILVLDELGGAHSKKSEDGVAWLEDRLFVIIEERYTRCRPILATSNLTKDSLPSSLGQRISSRLKEMTEIIDMNQYVKGDHRTKIASGRK